MSARSVAVRPHKVLTTPLANILGVRVRVTDYAQATERVLQADLGQAAFLAAASDVNAIMQATMDRRFAAVLSSFDSATSDDQPVR